MVVLSGAMAALIYASGVSFADVKRETRLTLGLPKFWVINFHEDVSSKISVDCPTGDPIVIVTGGQSNAANSFGPVSQVAQNEQAVMVFGEGCYLLSNPVLGATGDGESLWVHLGKELAQTTGRQVVFINGAVGRSQVSDWLDDRSQYRSRLVNSIKGAKSLGYTPDFVLWIQGETNAGVRVDPQEFSNGLALLITKIEQEAIINGQAQWVLYRSTHCTERPNNGLALENALARLTAPNDDRLHLGPSLTKFDNTMRHDDCHLNYVGRDALVAETMIFLKKISGDSFDGEPYVEGDSRATSLER